MPVTKESSPEKHLNVVFAGFKILMFYTATAPIILSFIYNITMDLKTVNSGGPFFERIPYSCDYWAVVYLLIIFLQVKKCASLKTAANETKLILQQIQLNYLGINDMVGRNSENNA